MGVTSKRRVPRGEEDPGPLGTEKPVLDMKAFLPFSKTLVGGRADRGLEGQTSSYETEDQGRGDCGERHRLVQRQGVKRGVLGVLSQGTKPSPYSDCIYEMRGVDQTRYENRLVIFLSLISKLCVLRSVVGQRHLRKTRKTFYKNTLVGETWSHLGSHSPSSPVSRTPCGWSKGSRRFPTSGLIPLGRRQQHFRKTRLTRRDSEVGGQPHPQPSKGQITVQRGESTTQPETQA